MSSYGYRYALEAAGATVIAEEAFGSWQGDALFHVTHDGRRGYVVIAYGSCSGCDAFEAAFGYGDRGRCVDHEYSDVDPSTCLRCVKAGAAYAERLAAFGARYLDDLRDAEAALARFREDASWDTGAPAVIAWVEAQEAALDKGETMLS